MSNFTDSEEIFFRRNLLTAYTNQAAGVSGQYSGSRSVAPAVFSASDGGVSVSLLLVLMAESPIYVAVLAFISPAKNNY
jgi:hypothetical protein